MGREIRRVPPDWTHPRTRRFNGRVWVEDYQPLFDKPFEAAAREWMDAAIAWDNGTDPDCVKHKATHPFYWQWSTMPPDPKYYRPRWTSEPTHYQVYETVSEGTPVTPHFATKEELIEYLVQHGDYWDQQRVAEDRQELAGWPRANAEDFVQREWAPSMTIMDGVIRTPRDGLGVAK